MVVGLEIPKVFEQMRPSRILRFIGVPCDWKGPLELWMCLIK